MTRRCGRLEEVAQDGKRLGLERDELPSPPELLVGGVEAEGGKGNQVFPVGRRLPNVYRLLMTPLRGCRYSLRTR